jgi:hypothetical protein
MVTLAIRLVNVPLLNKIILLKFVLHVHQARVVQMLFAVSKTVLVLAHA